MERKLLLLPGEVCKQVGIPFFGDDNPLSDEGLSLQKSAEAIVPEMSRHVGEGPNVRSSFFFSDPAGLFTMNAVNPLYGSYPLDDSLEYKSIEGAQSD